VLVSFGKWLGLPGNRNMSFKPRLTSSRNGRMRSARLAVNRMTFSSLLPPFFFFFFFNEENTCVWQAVRANNLLISRYDRNLRSAREKIQELEGKLKNVERTIADNNQRAKAGFEELNALKKETTVLKAERSKEAVTLENVLRQQTLLEARLAEEKENFRRFREENFAEEMAKTRAELLSKYYERSKKSSVTLPRLKMPRIW